MNQSLKEYSGPDTQFRLSEQYPTQIYATLGAAARLRLVAENPSTTDVRLRSRRPSVGGDGGGPILDDETLAKLAAISASDTAPTSGR